MTTPTAHTDRVSARSRARGGGRHRQIVATERSGGWVGGLGAVADGCGVLADGRGVLADGRGVLADDRRVLAAERSAGYDDPGSAPGEPTPSVAQVLTGLAHPVESACGIDLDEHTERELLRLAGGVQGRIDQLTVLRDRIAGRLQRRAITAAGHGRERGAVTRVRAELAAALGLSPSEVKQASERGRLLEDDPDLARTLVPAADTLLVDTAPADPADGPDPGTGPELGTDPVLGTGPELGTGPAPGVRADQGSGDGSGGDLGVTTDGGDETGRLGDVRSGDDPGADTGGRPTAMRGLRPEQIAAIGRTLRTVPSEHRERIRAAMIEAAATQDATELGRTGRRLLARLDGDAADRAETARHRRRYLAVRQTDDGMTTFHGQMAGLDAETLRTALTAFSTPDVASEAQRTPGQRTADALTDALRAALDGGSAPTDRGVRPHILATVPLTDLDAGDGVAELAHGGPIPARHIRRLATGATLRVAGIDVRGLPIAMSNAVEQPTPSLYLALQLRDGGCRYPGCDQLPAFCDIAHATARRDRGPLTLDNSLLLCRRHHRKLDLGDWHIAIDGWEATFTSPSGRSRRAGPARGRPPDTS